MAVLSTNNTIKYVKLSSSSFLDHWGNFYVLTFFNIKRKKMGHNEHNEQVLG